VARKRQWKVQETGGGVMRKKGGKNEFSKRNITWNCWRCLGKKVGYNKFTSGLPTNLVLFFLFTTEM
jgi:hypothetical protein